MCSPPPRTAAAPSPALRTIRTSSCISKTTFPRSSDTVHDECHGTICDVSRAYELNRRTNQSADSRRSGGRGSVRSSPRDGRLRSRRCTTASISRTTAYQYFPSQRALLRPPTRARARSLLPMTRPTISTRGSTSSSPRTRRRSSRTVAAATMLDCRSKPIPRRSQLPLRQGRVVEWLEGALADCRHSCHAGRASARHRHPQRHQHRSIVMADRCRWPLPRGRHRSHALIRLTPCSTPRLRADQKPGGRGAGSWTTALRHRRESDIVASNPSRPLGARVGPTTPIGMSRARATRRRRAVTSAGWSRVHSRVLFA